jgi:ATP-binding cassette, subfamily B, bacterial CvaB/MchF/RaxB
MADGTKASDRTLGDTLGGRLQFSWRPQLKMIHQSEVTECGLACLAMVANFHGHDLDLPALRARFISSLKGVTLAQIIGMAGRLGLHCRPVKVELSSLPRLKVPAILHWDLNHFVVLKSASAKFAVVYDPAVGIRKIPMAEVSQHFTGIALEVVRSETFERVQDRRQVSIGTLVGKVEGLGTATLQIFLLAVALEALNLTIPFYMQWIMDQVLVGADRDLLLVLGIGFGFVVAFQTASTALRSWMTTWLGAVINVQWMGNIAQHLLRLPLSWFEKRHVGDVISRLGATQTIQKTLTTQFIGSVLDGVMSIATLVVLGFYSVPLMLFVLAIFSIYGIARAVFFKPLRRANEEQIIASAKQQTEILESIRAVMPIQLANQQAPRASRYINTVVTTTNRDIRAQRLTITFSAVNQALFGLGRVLLLWLAATKVLNGQLSAGMLVAFVAYADQFSTRASGLIDKLVEFRMLGLHAERLADIALSPIEAENTTPWDGPLANGKLSVQNVSFRYSEQEPWILRNISFEVEDGESVAICGPSGCGKTTLAKIVAGLLKPTEGEVRFADVSIEKLGMERYRSILAAVMQDDSLLAGSIAENIVFGAQLVSQPERLIEAARAAQVHEDIARMPMGYQSAVGDMGSALSGGQKQRLILARALYREPRLLILDEATSHLDLACEGEVNSAIKALRTTRLIIAHRPETIASADRVVKLPSLNERV